MAKASTWLGPKRAWKFYGASLHAPRGAGELPKALAAAQERLILAAQRAAHITQGIQGGAVARQFERTLADFVEASTGVSRNSFSRAQWEALKTAVKAQSRAPRAMTLASETVMQAAEKVSGGAINTPARILVSEHMKLAGEPTRIAEAALKAAPKKGRMSAALRAQETVARTLGEFPKAAAEKGKLVKAVPWVAAAATPFAVRKLMEWFRGPDIQRAETRAILKSRGWEPGETEVTGAPSQGVMEKLLGLERMKTALINRNDPEFLRAMTIGRELQKPLTTLPRGNLGLSLEDVLGG